MKGKYWWTLIGGIIAGAYGPDLLASKAVQKGLRYLTAGAIIARDRILAVITIAATRLPRNLKTPSTDPEATI